MGDKYRLVAEIGAGANAVVYEATHLLTGKSFALKWLHSDLVDDADAVERLHREARAVGMIGHPNVVDVIDVGRDGDNPFLVLELLRGTSLAERLVDAPLEPAVVIRTLMPALHGIHAAHRKGILHRDLKPANLFVCTDDAGAFVTTKVLDFGVGKTFDRAIALESITDADVVVGTPSYMSPEQIRGRRDLDPRTDVYSMGVVLYEAITGELPFDADTVSELAVQVWTGWLRPPRMLVPDLDHRLETVIMRALARERDARIGDMDELARALEPFVADAEAPVGPPPSSRDAPAASRQAPAKPDTASIVIPPASWARPGVLAPAIVIVLLALGGAVWMANGSEPPPQRLSETHAPERRAEPAPRAPTPAAPSQRSEGVPDAVPHERTPASPAAPRVWRARSPRALSAPERPPPAAPADRGPPPRTERLTVDEF